MGIFEKIIHLLLSEKEYKCSMRLYEHSHCGIDQKCETCPLSKSK